MKIKVWQTLEIGPSTYSNPPLWKTQATQEANHTQEGWTQGQKAWGVAEALPAGWQSSPVWPKAGIRSAVSSGTFLHMVCSLLFCITAATYIHTWAPAYKKFCKVLSPVSCLN